MKAISYATIACVCVPLFASCATLSWTPDNPVEPTDKRLLVENRITEQAISDPLSAAQLIDYHQQTQTLFLPAELVGFRSSLEERFSEQLEEHVRSNNFNDALALFHSLQVADYPIPSTLSVDQIRRMEVLWHLTQDNYLPLLFSAHHIADYSVFDVDELTQILEIAARHNHRNLIAKIIKSIAGRHASLARTYRAVLQRPAPTLTEMLTGTVTVWVDKGFAITEGVGHPDRVFGSAFFVDTRGYLVTNYHVIASEVDPEYEGFSRLYIRLSDRSELRVPAKVVGYNRLLDIALLKTEIIPQFVFALEPYIDLYIPGMRAYALGSPAGLDKSISAGVVSASSRQFLPIGETIQIDVPVNPGNSGGPLVSEMGELIGVVYAGIPQFQGLNFAIPITWVWQGVSSLFAAENDRHFWLGVAVQKAGDRLEVVYVMPGSAAEEVGITVGDLLTHVNGRPVTEVHVAQAEIAAFHSRALVEARWKTADGTTRNYRMRIQPRPFSPMEEALDLQRREALFTPLFGMEVDRLGRGGINGRKFVIKKVYSATIADELGFAPADPFTLLRWDVDDEQRVVVMQIAIKKSSNGFTASGLQLFSRLDLPNFI